MAKTCLYVTYLMAVSTDAYNLEIFPSDTDVFVSEASTLSFIVGRSEVRAKVEACSGQISLLDVL